MHKEAFEYVYFLFIVLFCRATRISQKIPTYTFAKCFDSSKT